MIAFLRGINVGGASVIKMDRLISIFESAGYHNVKSFLASGNLIFELPETEEEQPATVEMRIEDLLKTNLNKSIVVFVRSIPDLQSLLERIPPDHQSATSCQIAFLKQPLSSPLRHKLSSTIASKQAESKETCTDTVEAFEDRPEMVWVSDVKQSESPLFKVGFEKVLGVEMSLRNVNTVRRIVDKFV
ncbi:hypothetical protein HK102_005913 [Quaeritorhiza haematococci]|nr:hypothetical protein HK102_005913 [Quaeritorhiza haematococci]